MIRISNEAELQSSPSAVFVSLTFRGQKMKQMDLASDSDCFYQLRNSNGVVLYESEVIENSASPLWKPTPPILLDDLFPPSSSRPLVFVCTDRDTVQDDAMGSLSIDSKDVIEAGFPKTSYEHGPLILKAEGDDAKKGETTAYGEIFILSCAIHRRPMFQDVLSPRTPVRTIALAVACDFSVANISSAGSDNADSESFGSASSSSLHSFDQNHPIIAKLLSRTSSASVFPPISTADVEDQNNLYLKILVGLFEQIGHNVIDPEVAVFGFGGIPAGSKDKTTPSFFSLSGDDDDPYCSGGLNGVCEAYCKAARATQLSGPAQSAGIINTVSKCATMINIDGAFYQILIILVHDAPKDLLEATAKIVESDSVPLSVVFVAVPGDGSSSSSGGGAGDSAVASVSDSRGLSLLKDLGASAENLVHPENGRLTTRVVVQVATDEEQVRTVVRNLPSHIFEFLASKNALCRNVDDSPSIKAVANTKHGSDGDNNDDGSVVKPMLSIPTVISSNHGDLDKVAVAAAAAAATDADQEQLKWEDL